VILGVVADVAECADQRLVHVAVEYQRPASRVQGDLQDAVLALHPHVLVFVAVVVEHRGRAPSRVAIRPASPWWPTRPYEATLLR